MSQRERASDVECLIFSDMVYEDFKNGATGDLNKKLSNVFSSSERFYKPAESLRDERFKEYSRSIKMMDNWEFIRKEGTNGHKNDFDKKSFSDVIDKLQNDDKYLAQDLGADECYWDGESSGFYAAAFKHNKRDEIMIAYRGTNQNYEDHLMTNALIASGIPSQQFEKAEQFYRRVKANHGTKETKFTFTGHSLGGGLAQWAAVMADGEVDYQSIIWNREEGFEYRFCIDEYFKVLIELQ